MAELRVSDVRLTDDFNAMAAELGVPMPWTKDENGALLASNGETVCVVDVWSDFPDEKMWAVLSLIELAGNTCGGFKAVAD